MQYIKTATKLTALSILSSVMACSDSTQFSDSTVPISASSQPAETGSSDATAQKDKTSEAVATDDRVVTQSASTDPLDNNSDPQTNHSSATPATQSGEGSASESNSGSGQPTGSVPNNEIFAACTNAPERAIVADVYQIPIDSKSLPNLQNLSSVDEVCMTQLNISNRDFNQGFPGVRNLIEWFALDIRFRVKIPTAGRYTFYLNSDDGSILYIDNVTIINNDGLHEALEKSAQITLAAGMHDFRLKYFQGPRYSIALELFWKRPGQNSKEYLPTGVISSP